MANSPQASGRRCPSWSGLALLLFLVAGAHGAAGGTWSDDDVKAAYLLRFTSYVTWPGASASPTDLAVLGSPDTAERLRNLMAGRGAARPMRIRSINRLEEAREAHMLYVSGARRIDPAALMRLSDGRGLLVVTDSERGLAAGGAINFLTVDRRVRFEVSLEAARRADVHISAELLAVAARVQGSRQGAP